MQFLKTKFYFPDKMQAKTVPRSMPQNSNVDSWGKKLVLICAPAGFGKTTYMPQLLSKWNLIEQTAWLSLDKGDNQPTRFWNYVSGCRLPGVIKWQIRPSR